MRYTAEVNAKIPLDDTGHDIIIHVSLPDLEHYALVCVETTIPATCRQRFLLETSFELPSTQEIHELSIVIIPEYYTIDSSTTAIPRETDTLKVELEQSCKVRGARCP